MRIIRTIHPIGQGAFYSERFKCDTGDDKLIVYDCGVQKQDSQYLNVELSSYFCKGGVIDIFFISHFDEDHINGISLLKKLGIKIKTVVVPLIDKNDKWFYICTGGALVKEVINNPKSFCNADNIIQVKPVEESSDNEKMEQSINNDGQDVPSGQPISCSGIPRYWVYIPFNFQEKKRIKKLIAGLKKEAFFTSEAEKRECEIEDLLHKNEFIEGNRDKINDVYKSVCADGSNRCSLVVYSGSAMETRISSENHPVWWRFKHWHWLDWKNREGCLYLGDTDLNQGCGRSKILDQLERLLEAYIDRIGIIQLPHHGAIKNYNKSLLTINNHIKLFFASFGTRNIYGHPSYYVIKHIICGGNYFYGVNEHCDFGLIEFISLEKATN